MNDMAQQTTQAVQNRFRNLSIGDSFNFIGPRTGFNSFFKRCTKTGARTYVDESGQRHRVGSIDADVYHVERKGAKS